MLFALWLTVTRHRRLAWWACFILFATFAAYIGILWGNGAASCGCFGASSVPPQVTFFIDIGVLLALLACRAGATPPPTPPTSARWRGVLPTLIVALPATAFAVEPLFAADGRPTPVEPAQWAGRSFDFADEIEHGERLRRGRWVVLFHHPGCRDCEAALTHVAARAAYGAADSPKFALVSTAATAAAAGSAPPPGFGLRTRLRQPDQLVLPTPTTVMIEDGVVRSTDSSTTPSFSEGR